MVNTDNNSNPESVQLSLLTDNDFYYPLYIARKYDKPLAHHIVGPVFWASVIDWITVFVGSRNKALEDWKKISIGISNTPTELKDMGYIGRDGKTYPAIFASERLLYTIVQNMRSVEARPQVAELKQFLANSGIILSELARNPEQAAEIFRAIAEGRKVEFESLSAENLKKYRRLIASGFDPREADQWMQFDKLGLEAFNKIRSKWFKRDGDIPKLVNATTKAVTGFTATELKGQWDVTDTPRNYMSTVEKAALGWVENVSATIHDVNNSQGTSELLEDINHVASAIDMNKIDAYLKTERVKRPLPKPKQYKLIKDGE